MRVHESVMKVTGAPFALLCERSTIRVGADADPEDVTVKRAETITKLLLRLIPNR